MLTAPIEHDHIPNPPPGHHVLAVPMLWRNQRANLQQWHDVKHQRELTPGALYIVAVPHLLPGANGDCHDVERDRSVLVSWKSLVEYIHQGLKHVLCDERQRFALLVVHRPCMAPVALA